MEPKPYLEGSEFKTDLIACLEPKPYLEGSEFKTDLIACLEPKSYLEGSEFKTVVSSMALHPDFSIYIENKDVGKICENTLAKFVVCRVKLCRPCMFPSLYSYTALGECTQPQSTTGTQPRHDQSDIRTFSDDPQPQTGQSDTEFETSKSKEVSPDTMAAVTGNVPHKTFVDDSQNSQHKPVKGPSSSLPVDKVPQPQSSSEEHEEISDSGGQMDSVAGTDGTKQVPDNEPVAHEKTSRQLSNDAGMRPHANSMADTSFVRPEDTPDMPARSSEDDSVSNAGTAQQNDKTVQEAAPHVNPAADLHPEDKKKRASEPNSDPGFQPDRTESEEDGSKKRVEEGRRVEEDKGSDMSESFEAGKNNKGFEKSEEDIEYEENDRSKEKEEEEEEEEKEEEPAEGV